MKKSWHNLSKSETIRQIPAACSDETAAVEFFEFQRWGNTPCCVKCGSVAVYQMKDAKTGERSKRYLWRCRDCKEQYTVRIGTVYEESRLPMRHWAYAFWRASTSKKGVSALEIQRHCLISYKSALFLMNRIRFAMAPLPGEPKLSGIVEMDETYVGGKPRKDGTTHKRGGGTKKIPVFAAVERDGNIHRRVVPRITGDTIREAMKSHVDPLARLMTDEAHLYKAIDKECFIGGHETVCHSSHEYARGDVNTNTAESSFALVKRGIYGVYHNVSKEYLHRYIWQFDFMWNGRKLNDGQRTVLAIRMAEGKRMMYKEPLAS
jgi:transposase-like protein